MTATDPTRITDALAVPPRPIMKIVDEPAPMPDADVIDATLSTARRSAWTATIPARFADASLEDLESGDTRAALGAWAGEPIPQNLILFGDIGVGKTHAAIASCRRRFECSYTATPEIEFVPVSELLDRLDWRRPDSAEYLDWACRVPMLVLDDFGTQRTNEWVGERLYVIVNRRWLERRPVVVTTNLEPRGDDSLEASIGPRTYSRLADSAIALALGGDDRRRAR